MTEAEAFQRIFPAGGCASVIEVGEAKRFVRFAVALGMLKLDEPKTIGQRVTKCLSGPFELAAAIEIQMLLDQAGLKIVSK
jgi:hypothetical protein